MVKNSIIKFLKIREVLSPTRGYPTDAGIDFYVPKFNASFIKDLKEKNKDLFPDINPIIAVVNSCNQNIEDNTRFKFDEKEGMPYFTLPPGFGVNIPSGLKSRMEEQGRALIAANKSGIATKYGLIFSAQVVDYTYMGEIHIGVINTSRKIVPIYEDMKLIQFIETPIYTSDIEVLEERDPSTGNQIDFYKDMIMDRKDGAFGSTNKK